MKAFLAVVLSSTLIGMMGCATADYTRTNRVNLDDESMDGGISSADVRSVASTMCPSLLAVPEVAMADDVVRIKVADIKNSSRFFIDRNLFAKRLCVELNRYSEGTVRFINGNTSTQAARKEVLADRSTKELKKQIKRAAEALVASPIVTTAKTPIKVAVIPVLNANLVNMNADSFAAMFRSEVADAANGKVQFLMPGATEGADYWLTGQFYPESMKQEGIINLANYISVIDERVKTGKSLYLSNVRETTQTANSVTTTYTSPRERELEKMLKNPAFQENPNCEKNLNLMLVNPADQVAVWEKTVVADRKVSSNAGNARYILSGEISGMSQNSNGRMSDYILITMELVDTESNEIIWQDAYEVKRLTKAGVVYR